MKVKLLDSVILERAPAPAFAHSVRGIVFYKVGNFCFDLELFE